VGSKYNNINQQEEMKVYRDMVPHLSSRDLENLEFSFRDQNGGTKIFDIPSSSICWYITKSLAEASSK
jgi:hypothetical protein